MEKAYKITCISSFWLKIAAILTMTIDHIGVVLSMFFYEYPIVREFIYPACRIIGRLALPLFCFMVVEGVLHTRSFKKYILSLGIIGTSVLIGHMFLVHVMKGSMNQGNIFLDLILGAIMIKCLMSKKIYIKVLSILPIAYALFIELTYNIKELGFFPEYLKTQYGLYSIALILGFYLCYLLTNLYYNTLYKKVGLSHLDFKDSEQYRLIVNSLAILVITIVSVVFLFISYLDNIYINLDASLQCYAILSGALLLLYNGKRGYNSIGFKYGCYIYYPLHLLVIYGIGYLIALL